MNKISEPSPLSLVLGPPPTREEAEALRDRFLAEYPYWAEIGTAPSPTEEPLMRTSLKRAPDNGARILSTYLVIIDGKPTAIIYALMLQSSRGDAKYAEKKAWQIEGDTTWGVYDTRREAVEAVESAVRQGLSFYTGGLS